MLISNEITRDVAGDGNARRSLLLIGGAPEFCRALAPLFKRLSL